jgi:hypothetical protein
MTNSRRRLAATLLLCTAAAVLQAAEPPVLRVPGAADRTISPTSLNGRGRMDVHVEAGTGDAVLYHGLPLLEVIENAGVETKTMAGQRKTAPAIVVATSRDGYTVAFSMGELLMHRSDPHVFLVSESAGGPLPENEGPVRLIVLGDRARSAYGLRVVEMRYVAQNPAAPSKSKR